MNSQAIADEKGGLLDAIENRPVLRIAALGTGKRPKSRIYIIRQCWKAAFGATAATGGEPAALVTLYLALAPLRITCRKRGRGLPASLRVLRFVVLMLLQQLLGAGVADIMPLDNIGQRLKERACNSA
jgi:hypothetical protein